MDKLYSFHPQDYHHPSRNYLYSKSTTLAVSSRLQSFYYRIIPQGLSRCAPRIRVLRSKYSRNIILKRALCANPDSATLRLSGWLKETLSVWTAPKVSCHVLREQQCASSAQYVLDTYVPYYHLSCQTATPGQRTSAVRTTTPRPC